MFEKTDYALICAKNRMNNYMDQLIHEEKGAADIVAILVVIVIVLAVAAVFRQKLIDLVNKVFEKGTDWVEAN